MKLTVVPVNQFTLVNLNGLSNRVQMNTEDLAGIAIVITIKLLNTAGKHIATLTGMMFSVSIMEIFMYKEVTSNDTIILSSSMGTFLM